MNGKGETGGSAFRAEYDERDAADEFAPGLILYEWLDEADATVGEFAGRAEMDASRVRALLDGEEDEAESRHPA